MKLSKKFTVLFFIASAFLAGGLFLVSIKAATEVVGLVGQDCTGYSNCYTSLSAWEANYGGVDFTGCTTGDLVCADKIAVAQIDGVWTAADASSLTIVGWTTD